MVGTLVSSGPGSSPGRGNCVVFLGKALSPPRCINGYRRINAGGNPATETGDKRQPDGPLSSYSDLHLTLSQKLP